jgi:hypothetical protein
MIPLCLLSALSTKRRLCARAYKVTLWKGKGNTGRFMAVCVILLMAKEEVNDGSGFF